MGYNTAMNSRLFSKWMLVSAVLALFATLAWPSTAASQSGTLLRVVPQTARATTCGETLITVRVEDVENLNAFSLTLRYDPAAVQVLEVENGGFLEAGILEPANGIDPENGLARFGLAQLSGSEPKSGSGELVRLRLSARQAGLNSAIEIDVDSKLVHWPSALPIPFATEPGEVLTAGCQGIYLPFVRR